MNYALNLIHLKFFCDAAVYASITESAKMNHISQSAVSQAITKLESVFGIQLFFNNRQKLQLTEEGKIVFDQARAIFKTVQETFDKVAQTKNHVSGNLKIATTNSLGLSFFAPTYQKMRLEFPHIDISHYMGNLNFIRNALRQGDAELGIIVYDPSFSCFDERNLIKGQFNLYQSTKASSKLINEGILIDNHSSLNIDLLKDFLEKHHSDIKIQAELNGWEMVARFTTMKLGVGFLPDYLLSNNRNPQLKKHPLDLPSMEYKISAIHNKGIKLTQAALAFLEQFSLE
ncbi:MAG TPA: LysR family transcriptional regulator [Parachlamydiaceae bacterium]|nr:LysR family transcriptional regulator [Parachlamydiaceae bacterium]